MASPARFLFDNDFAAAEKAKSSVTLTDHAAKLAEAESVGYRVVRQGSLPSPGFWIMSIRNCLGMNSRERGSSLLEFLNFRNLAVVGGFTALDLVLIALGMSTSNQFVLLTPVTDRP